jgi:hypothetical protein
VAFLQVTNGRFSLAKVRAGRSEAPLILKGDMGPFSQPVWSPDGKWIACGGREGLSLVSAGDQGSRALSDQVWLVYGWTRDSSRLYGIRVSDDLRYLTLAVMDVGTGTEHVINPNLGPLPLANHPVRGFSRISDNLFGVSVVRVRSDVWLLEGFQTSPTLPDKLRALLSPAWR